MKILIFGDVHANMFAVQYIKQKIKHADGVWFLGDFVGRGPHLHEVVQFWREFSTQSDMWVIGNHDAYVWDLLTHEEKSVFSNGKAATLDVHKEMLFEMDDQIRDLVVDSRKNVRWFDKTHYAIVHASPDDPLGVRGESTYYYPENWTLVSITQLGLIDPFSRLAHKKRFKNAVLFCGHTHVPMIANKPPGEKKTKFMDFQYGVPVRIPEGITVINPGSLGNPRVSSNSYVVLDMEKETVTFQAFQLSENCIRMLIMDLNGIGFPADIKRSFQKPANLIKVQAEYPELYQKIHHRETQIGGMLDRFECG
jgi:predicted phosphodiesterase